MTQDSSTYWKKSRVELRAAGFEPDRAADASAVVTIAAAWTNAHRCNNRVRSIADLLVEIVAERGGQGLIVGAPAVSDALTQGTPTAGYSLVYLIGSGLASLYYVVRTVRGIYREEHYGRAFFASIIYMLVVMLLLNIDILVH